jgi:hypothetical protein
MFLADSKVVFRAEQFFEAFRKNWEDQRSTLQELIASPAEHSQLVSNPFMLNRKNESRDHVGG